jgi:hypothetical protein
MFNHAPNLIHNVLFQGLTDHQLAQLDILDLHTRPGSKGLIGRPVKRFANRLEPPPAAKPRASRLLKLVQSPSPSKSCPNYLSRSGRGTARGGRTRTRALARRVTLTPSSRSVLPYKSRSSSLVLPQLPTTESKEEDAIQQPLAVSCRCLPQFSQRGERSRST